MIVQVRLSLQESSIISSGVQQYKHLRFSAEHAQIVGTLNT